MRARRWGRIVNLSSIGAPIGAASVSIGYGAAKAGVEGLTRVYAVQLVLEGVTVNAVAPGLVDTDAQGQGEATVWIRRDLSVQLDRARPHRSLCASVTRFLPAGLDPKGEIRRTGVLGRRTAGRGPLA